MEQIRASELLTPLKQAPIEPDSPLQAFLAAGSVDQQKALLEGKHEAFQHLISASDAFDSLGDVLLRSMFAPAHLLRAILECSGLSSWLTDPSADLREHVARAAKMSVPGISRMSSTSY